MSFVKLLYSMKFAIILLIVIGVYSFSLVAFNEVYPSYTKEMFNQVVNGIENVDSKFNDFTKDKDMSTPEKAESVQLDFIRKSFYVDIHDWSESKYFVVDRVLQLFDQFKSYNYRFLLGLLTLSLLLCVINNTSPIFKKTFGTVFRDYKEIENMDYHKVFSTRFSPDKLSKLKFSSQNIGGETQYYLVKGRLSFSGAYLVHVGMILLVIGGLVISLYGIRFHATAWELENKLLTSSQKSTYGIDFDIKVNSYNVTYTDNRMLFTKDYYDVSGYGRKMIADFISDLSVFENGELKYRKSIEVNDPLEYKNFTFYQANSSEINENEMSKLGRKVFDKALVSLDIEGLNYKTIIRQDGLFKIGNTDFTIIPENFQCDFLNIYGPSEKPYMRSQQITFSVFKKDEYLARYIVSLDPNVETKVVRGNEKISNVNLLELEPFYMTGIEVATSPGSSLIWLGFILSTIGLIFSFYLNFHQIFISTKGGRFIVGTNTKLGGDEFFEKIIKQFS
ncbi:MAG: cytochrome c biogenesis protein ResB [Candidatus Delongbacteria bacterium]|nr:cytochrome c biogenesis protein ResB [Candidatus Delongbacteria bacterium]MBN2833820.1 cytochrome c biogenesis protein ResB [Candidatus Delongbacteria bacterium]